MLSLVTKMEVGIDYVHLAFPILLPEAVSNSNAPWPWIETNERCGCDFLHLGREFVSPEFRENCRFD